MTASGECFGVTACSMHRVCADAAWTSMGGDHHARTLGPPRALRQPTDGIQAGLSGREDDERMSPTLIRAVIVDDHPAMRAGIAAVLDRAQDITLVGEAEGARELWPLLQRTDPDVVLMDF